MPKFYVSTDGVTSWQALLADPIKHWKTGYSAKALAYSWEEAQGFPAEICSLFKGTDLEGCEFLFGVPEHQVPLPGGSTKSQNDVFVIAKNEEGLISIAVEGKVSESFGPTLGDWLKKDSPGKRVRLDYLKSQIGLCDDLDSGVRYQLLHRTASAVIEAKRFNAKTAVMIVHSFSPSNEWFDDYSAFIALYGKSAEVGEMVSLCDVDGVKLSVGWAKGNDKYLKS
jgi:hypothetical protein